MMSFIIVTADDREIDDTDEGDEFQREDQSKGNGQLQRRELHVAKLLDSTPSGTAIAEKTGHFLCVDSGEDDIQGHGIQVAKLVSSNSSVLVPLCDKTGSFLCVDNGQDEPQHSQLQVSKEVSSSPTKISALAMKTGRFVCTLCGKSYSKRTGLSRHKKIFHNIKGVENGKGACRFCGNRCSRENLVGHEKSCGNRIILRRRQYCTVAGCGISFFKKEELIEHLKVMHNEEIEPMQRFTFNSEEEFKEWKEKEENNTFSFFSKHTGTKKGCDTYYCQHDGSSRIHRRDPTNHVRTKQNKKGRIKDGKTCISFIRVKRCGENLTVHYWPTHSHPLSPDDVKHHPLSEATYLFIREQIHMNIPCRQIQAAVKKKLAESDDPKVRDTHITLKRINSLAKRIRASNNFAITQEEDILGTFVDILIAQEDSPIILYKPACLHILSKESVEDTDFFFIGVQTEHQQRMLQREVTMPMFIGVAKGPHTFNNYLISVVVPCEDNFEYPVGHLITNRMNTEAICLFLQAIGERCPELNVNCIIYEDYPELNEAIKQVFGEDGPYFLSKWHFLKSARKAITNVASEDMIEELYDFVLAMADAETEERFVLLYNTFHEQFKETAPDPVSLVSEYVSRAASWASCYRQFPGVIDSSLYVDSFHNKLRKLYRRRPTKIPNLLLELLLVMQEDYRDKRVNLLLGHVDAASIEEHHNASLEMSSDFVQGTLFNHWSVTGSKNGQEFSVMQCLPKCIKRDCKLQCNSCGQLCSHVFYCTCTSGRTICKHVQKVHAESCTIVKLEGLCEMSDEAENTNGQTYENTASDMDVDNSEPVNDVNLKLSILENIESLKSYVEQDQCSEETINLINETLASLLSEVNSVSKEN